MALRGLQHCQAAKAREVLLRCSSNIRGLPFDIPIAVRMGNIDGYLKEKGLQLPVPDLIIAATALELEYAIATHNLKDFNRIPGLQIATLKA